MQLVLVHSKRPLEWSTALVVRSSGLVVGEGLVVRGLLVVQRSRRGPASRDIF